MAHVSIIGTGNMGQAIAGVVRKSGNTVELLGQSDADKPVTGDVVVLAVPYGAVADIVARRAEQLAGKVVVDITNPVDFETFDSLVVPPTAPPPPRSPRRCPSRGSSRRSTPPSPPPWPPAPSVSSPRPC